MRRMETNLTLAHLSTHLTIRWNTCSPKKWFPQITKCICSNSQMHLSKLSNVFVQIFKYICPNRQIYLSKLPNVFSKTVWCIWQPRDLHAQKGQATPATFQLDRGGVAETEQRAAKPSRLTLKGLDPCHTHLYLPYIFSLPWPMATKYLINYQPLTIWTID